LVPNSTPDPALALLVFSALLALGAVVFWPKIGLFWRARRLARLTERVTLEDGLKHLINCELAGRTGSIESLGGALEISRGRALKILSDLATRGLVNTDGAVISLTPDGHTYGMRMVRAHRLLERYFADRTGIAPAEWHERAEREEHRISEAEADHLAASLGNPLMDPHGDPIPSGSGILPPASGVPLSSMAPGAVATIVHVEDEPREAYDRLRRIGINPAVPVKVLAARPGALTILVAGVEQVLDPVLAGNVTVEPVAERDTHTVLLERLDALRLGQTATVAQIAAMVQGPERRRLLDLGVIPGTVVVAEMSSPSGNPIAYRIRGALIALRREQAHGILISRLLPPAPTERVA
jgi:DtxR family Mn-dependent transcriptional regulator